MENIRTKKVITRKAHNCWGCGDTFKAGSSLCTWTCVDGGTISNSYWCKPCKDYLGKLPGDVFQDGIPYGGVKEDREAYGLEYHRPFKPKETNNVTI